MKPYSTDLRLKILETKKKTNESIEKLAERFQVSYSFVNRLIKRYETTGSVEPKPHGGGQSPKLKADQWEVVVKLVEEDNDATLQQLCDRLAENTGIRVSVPTMCRILQKLKLTRKKSECVILGFPQNVRRTQDRLFTPAKPKRNEFNV